MITIRHILLLTFALGIEACSGDLDESMTQRPDGAVDGGAGTVSAGTGGNGGSGGNGAAAGGGSGSSGSSGGSSGGDANDCTGEMECVDVEDGGACVAATGPVGNGKCRDEDSQCFACRCASPDTPVATPDGERPIASLEVGDLVYSIDGAGIRVVPIARVSRVAAHHHEVMRVRLATGRTLEISPGHPTADGRLFAALREGEQLGDNPIVEAALIEYTHAFTHDILPASSTGTYFAAGVAIGSTLFEPQAWR